MKPKYNLIKYYIINPTYFKMSEMYIYVPKLPLFTFYCNARGFVLIIKLFIYLFHNFCHNKTHILYYIISYSLLNTLIYNMCHFSYILKYSMFTFDFPPFSPFVCQKWRQLKYCKPERGRGLWNGLLYKF